MPAGTRKSRTTADRGGQPKSRGGGQVGSRPTRQAKKARIAPQYLMEPERNSATVDHLSDYGSSEDEERDPQFRPEDEPSVDSSEDENDNGEDQNNDGAQRSLPGPSQSTSNKPDSRPTKRRRATLPATTAHPSVTEKLTYDNYSELARKLGRPALERLMADPSRKINNRPSPKTLGEAQARQSHYSLDKMGLCLVGHISLRTLELAL